MKFKVLKSGLDGILGGESNFATIKDVLREVCYHKGWASVEELHQAIVGWAEGAHPGDVFCTQATAVVAVAVDRLDCAEDVCPHCEYSGGLEYEEFDPVEGGQIEQRVKCPECNERWVDVFVLVEQRPLCKDNSDA